MNKESIAKNMGLTGIGLCVLCCALPLIGMTVGIGAFTAVAFYMEKIGIVLIGAGVIFFLYNRFKNEKQAPSCSTGCGCKEEPVKSQ